MQEYTLSIQAADSQTMGQVKHCCVQRLPLIAYIAQRGKELTDVILVTTNKIESFQFLESPHVPDLCR